MVFTLIFFSFQLSCNHGEDFLIELLFVELTLIEFIDYVEKQVKIKKRTVLILV